MPQHSHLLWTAQQLQQQPGGSTWISSLAHSTPHPIPPPAPSNLIRITPELLARAKSRADEAATLAAISASHKTSPTVGRKGHVRSRHNSLHKGTGTNKGSKAAGSKNQGDYEDTGGYGYDGLPETRRRARRSAQLIDDADGSLLDDNDLDSPFTGMRGSEPRSSTQEKQITDFLTELSLSPGLMDPAFSSELGVVVADAEQAAKQSHLRRRKPNPVSSTSGYTRSQSAVSSLISSDEEGDGNEDNGPASPPKRAGAQSLTPFWSSIAPYIRDITEADLQLLLPTLLSEDDPLWSLPTLKNGPPSSQRPPAAASAPRLQSAAPTASTSADTPLMTPRPVTSTGQPPSSSGQPSSSSSSSASQLGSGSGDSSDEFTSCGDLTERILSALVEEHLIHKSNKQASRGPSFNLNSDLPLNKAPIPHYSQQATLSLEDRIKLELKAIGLLGPSFSQSPTTQDTVREDDEISSEIRSLQSQLRDQIRINNERKSKLHQLALRVMKCQEQERAFRSLDAEVERIHSRAAASEKRARPRKRRH